MKKSLIRVGIGVGVVIAIIAPVAATTATAEAFEAVVNTTDDIDDGVCDAVHCSLREAISAANERAGPDTITFAPTVFPLSGTGVIKLTSPLPDIYDGGTTIDTTGAKVTIDGGNLASFPGDIEDIGDIEHISGLCIRSSGNTVMGIRIIGMPGNGINITSDEAFRPRWPADNNTLIGITVVNNGYGPPPFTSREDGIVIEARGASSSASGNRVINCTVEDNADDGIIVQVRNGGAGNDNVITGCIVRNNAENGVEIDAEGPGSSASRNTVANNTIEGHQYPGSLNVWSDDGGRADENILRSNIVVAGLDRGIWIVACNIGSSTTANIIINNTVENHVKDGISVESHTGGIADGNIVKGNAIQRSGGVGIHIATDGNLIYHNDIIDNDTQARDYGSNHWDHDGEGNYWSDYQERYPAAWEHPEHKGIWDTSYWIPDGSNKDMYPLMPPTPMVRTKEVTDLTMDSATLKCDFTLGDYDSVCVCFRYRESAKVDWTGTAAAIYNASGSHSDTISRLQPSTDYKFKAQVRYDNAIVSGEQREFTTFAIIGKEETDRPPQVVLPEAEDEEVIPVVTPPSKPGVNWPLIAGIIGGVIVVGLGIFFWMRRRRIVT